MEKKCENCKHAYYVYGCEFACKYYDTLQCNSENLNHYEPKISKKTNRQWLESLSNSDLAMNIWCYIKQIKEGVKELPSAMKIDLMLRAEHKE